MWTISAGKGLRADVDENVQWYLIIVPNSERGGFS
jgi:hypothetical protein